RPGYRQGSASGHCRWHRSRPERAGWFRQAPQSDGTHHGRSSQEVLRIGGLVLADHRPGSTLLMRGILMSSSIREYPVITGALAVAIGLTSAVIGLTLSGCATQRVTGPDVMALPAQGEPFEVFEQHDVTCRQYATAQIGGQSPREVAAASGMTGAA